MCFLWINNLLNKQIIFFSNSLEFQYVLYRLETDMLNRRCYSPVGCLRKSPHQTHFVVHPALKI